MTKLANMLSLIPLQPLVRPGAQAEFALDVSGQWIWELDFTTDRVWRSRHWKTVLGYYDHEIVDNTVPWDIVDPHDRLVVADALRAVEAEESEFFEAVYRVTAKDGMPRWIFSRGKIVDRAMDGRPLRLLAVSMDITRQKRTEEELHRALSESERLRIQLVEANLRLEALSGLDALTGLPNRRSFDLALSEAIARQQAACGLVSILMIDVDRFKSYNDSLGHQAGDEALRVVAVALSEAADAGGHVSRYGGEEFALILEGSGLEDATATARRCLAIVRQKAIPHPKGIDGRVTVSIGVAEASFKAGCSASSGSALVNAADVALYGAKRAGRNQLRAAG